MAADGEDLQTSRFVTVEPDLPPDLLAPAAAPRPTPTPEALRLALGTTPPPQRARALTVPIRNTPSPRMIPLAQAPPPRVAPPPVPPPRVTVLPPPPPPRVGPATVTSVSSLTKVTAGRLGLWVTLAACGVVAVGLLAMLATSGDERPLAARVPTPVAAPAASAKPAPARTTKPAPKPAPAPIAASRSAAPEVVTLRVTTDPDGATVLLDGTRLGTTPFVTTVPAGPREAILKVRKRGHRSRRISVTFDQDVTWDVQLRRR